MSGKRRVYQVAERIKEVVASTLLRSADPRLSLVTVTSAMVSPDLRNAKVYWVVSLPTGVDRDERLNQVDEALENAQGMFRRVIGKELGLRFVPEIRFYYDDTYDTVDQVERLLYKIRTTEGAEQGQDTASEATDTEVVEPEE